MQNSVKSMPKQGISQYELVNYLLQNLYKWKLSPIEQLVLLQLAYHYNPANKFMFPKQKTIAHQINASERSVIRAIQSLVRAGLILVVCGNANRYTFGSKLTSELVQNEKFFGSDNMSDNNDKISSESDSVSPTLIEQTKELIKEPTNVEDYKILKDYAIKHNAKNVHAYINFLKSSGAAMQIVQEYQQSKRRSGQMKNKTEEYLKSLEYAKQNCAVVPEGWFDEIRNKLK